jgi:hypothetical protein
MKAEKIWRTPWCLAHQTSTENSLMIIFQKMSPRRHGFRVVPKLWKTGRLQQSALSDSGR